MGKKEIKTPRPVTPSIDAVDSLLYGTAPKEAPETVEPQPEAPQSKVGTVRNTRTVRNGNTSPKPKAGPKPAPAAPITSARGEDDEKVLRIPFTNNLPVPLYTKWVAYSYWGRKKLHKILDAALEAYLADKPEALMELEEEEKVQLEKKIQKEMLRRGRIE